MRSISARCVLSSVLLLSCISPLAFAGFRRSFSTTGSLNVARSNHTATLLNNGQVFIAGGFDQNYAPLASAELYDPSTQAFASVPGSLTVARFNHAAALLDDGRVLLIGGFDANYHALASTEIYDPFTETFSPGPNLATGRSNPAIAVLQDGRVLVIGGQDANFNALASAEIYDPVANAFTPAANMNIDRAFPSATVLSDGRVLVFGGWCNEGPVLATAEIYDPIGNAFTFTGSATDARFVHSATLLNGTQVLTAGGLDLNYNYLASAELFNPSSGVFAYTGTLNDARDQQTATLLTNGTVFLAGGLDANGVAASTELFDPTSGSFSYPGDMIYPRDGHTATLLSDGTVLLVGGMMYASDSGMASTAEIYLPWSPELGGLVSITVMPSNAVIPGGASTPISAVGTFDDNSTQPLSGVVWSSSDPSVISVTTDASNRGHAFGWSSGTANVSACALSMCGSTPIAVTSTYSVPGIRSVVSNYGPVGARILVLGGGFGASAGTVSIAGTPMTIVDWSDSRIDALVADGTVDGQVTVQQGSATLLGPNFSVMDSFPYTVSPTSANMVAGESRTFAVTDSNSNPVTGLNWMATDQNLVSLSTDDPPIVTARAPGTVTLYAGEIAIPVTVYADALPAGTPIWTTPVGGNVGDPLTVVPAVPSANAADVFAFRSGVLTAVSADGTNVWSASFGYDAYSSLTPDFSGSAYVREPYNYTDGNGVHTTHVLQWLDPSTHQPSIVYTFAEIVNGQIASSYGAYYNDTPGFSGSQVIVPHPSGIVFIQDVPNAGTSGACALSPGCTAKVSVVNPATATTIATVNLDNSITDDFAMPPQVGSLIVAGDGNAYLPYTYYVQHSSDGATRYQQYMKVLRVAPDGTYAKLQLNYGETDTTSDGNGGGTYSQTGWFPGYASTPAIITNADTGAAVFTPIQPYPSWNENGGPDPTLQINYVSQNGVDSQVLVNDGGDQNVRNFVPTLQRADGSYIGNGGTAVIAMTQSGSALWSADVGPSSATPLYALADNSVVTTTQAGHGQPATVFWLDKDGNSLSEAPDIGAKYSWSGAWYASTLTGQVQSFATALDLHGSPTPAKDGNLSGTRAAVPVTNIALYWCSAGLNGSGSNGCVGEQPLGFTYAPKPQTGSPTSSYDLTQSNPDLVRVIQAQALKTLTASFKGTPIAVFLGSHQVKCIFSWWPAVCAAMDTQKDEGAHRLYVVANANDCGAACTAPGSTQVSRANFWNNMVQAQVAAQDAQGNNLAPSYPPTAQNRSQFIALMTAIGRGIGSNGAHEIGHQFSLPKMDCHVDVASGIICDNNDPHVLEYWDGTGDPDWFDTQSQTWHYYGQRNYVGTPLFWGSTNFGILKSLK